VPLVGLLVILFLSFRPWFYGLKTTIVEIEFNFNYCGFQAGREAENVWASRYLNLNALEAAGMDRY